MASFNETPLCRSRPVPSHPDAKTSCRNVLLQEELMPLISPPCTSFPNATSQPYQPPSKPHTGSDLRRHGGLVLGKTVRTGGRTASAKRKPINCNNATCGYSFLDCPAPHSSVPAVPSKGDLPSAVLSTLRCKAQPTGLLSGLVYCLSAATGSDIYTIDVAQASEDLHCLFLAAKKERIVLVYRGKERVGAGSGILVVNPVCVDRSKLWFAAAEIREMQMPAESSR